MGFWMLFFLFVGFTALSMLLQKRPSDVQPSALGDFQAPTAEEGRPIPVIFGTVKLAAPNVVWFGDLRVDPIKKSAGGFLGIGAKHVTVGYKYNVGMWMALCHGAVDELVDILVGDKSFAANPTATFRILTFVGTNPTCTPALPEPRPGSGGKVSFALNWPVAFGGDDKEGGIGGPVDFYYGSNDQTGSSYLASKLGLGTAPAYNSLCHVVCKQTYVGTSQYMKNWAFILRRCPSNLGLSSGVTNLSGDANPAEIIYEILTNQIWGLGVPTVRIDASSFIAAANTLATEGMGMSLQLDSTASADDVISDVIRHIDGVLYTDPQSGLWTLKLARADYDPATLLEFTPADIIELSEFSRGSWEETLNDLKVTFTDRATFDKAMVQAQETANYAITGELKTASINFLGFSNATIAQKVAMRELRTHSYPIGRGRIKTDRKAWPLRIGGPFKLTWPALGISGMAVRVLNIDYGRLEKGEIEIEFCEDVFYVAHTAYTAPSGTAWVDPFSTPGVPLAQLLEEVPYQVLGVADRRVMVAAVRGDGSSQSFEVWSDEGAGYYQSNEVDSLCPSGTLTAAYPRNTAALDTTGFTVNPGTFNDLGRLESTDAAGRVQGANLLRIDNEWMSWTTVTDNHDGTYTISGLVRGIFDTIPADHAINARVWFLSDGSGVTREEPFVADQSISVKCLPKNSKGSVALGSVSAVSITTASRAQKPYPPGNVKVNGNFWPTTITGDATLTWAKRIRTVQSNIVQQDAGDVSGSLEGTVTVEVLVNGVLKQTYSGLTGTSQIYTAAQRVIDDANPAHTVQFRITPVNGSLQGTVRTTDPFLMT